MIPPIFFQTNKNPPERYVEDLIRRRIGDWSYEFYDDEAALAFFKENPVADLPNVALKFNSLRSGAHKADLFRYYYLFVKGGVFMDSDAMIYADISSIVADCDFVSVNSSGVPGTIFQGIIGSTAGNEVVKRALYQAYATPDHVFNCNYHCLTKQLYDILKQNHGCRVKLLEERKHDEIGHVVFDPASPDVLLFKHYQIKKVIPNIDLLE
jgi:mannosyltransferase OCH1-like enzyme